MAKPKPIFEIRWVYHQLLNGRIRNFLCLYAFVLIYFFSFGSLAATDSFQRHVLDALQNYHATQVYTQTPEQFRAAPDLYFKCRIAALEQFLEQLKDAPHLQDLKKIAENKLAYLREVPKGLHPDYIQRRILKNKKQKNLAVKHFPLLVPRKRYWTELWDPLHRSGPEMELRVRLWKKSTIPSFFIFLETIENDVELGVCHQVRYLDVAEQEKQRLEFRDGLAYLNGVLFDTKTYLKDFPGAKITIYVLSEEGSFYIYPHKRYIWQHSSMLRAAPVLDAGEMLFEQGILKKISNRSGHYAPTKETLLRSLRKLHKMIRDFEKLEVKVFEFHPYTKKLLTRISYRADQFLAKEGLAIPVRTERLWKALHVIVWNDDRDHFSVVSRPRYLNARDREGNTPLHLAVIKNNLFMVRALLTLGADPTIFNQKGVSALHLAVRYASPEVLQILLQFASPDWIKIYGLSFRDLSVFKMIDLLGHFSFQIGKKTKNLIGCNRQ